MKIYLRFTILNYDLLIYKKNTLVAESISKLNLQIIIF